LKQYEPKTNKLQLLTQIRALIDKKRLRDDYCQMARELEKQMFFMKARDIFSAQLHSTLNIESIYEIIRKLAVEFVGIEVFQIFFYDDDGRFHYLGSADGVADDAIKEILTQSRDELIADVMQAKRIIVFKTESQGSPREVFTTSQGKSLTSDADLPIACIPMMMDDQTKGVMLVERLMSQKRKLDEEDFELLSLLMSESTLAINNGNAHRRLENAAKTDGLTGLYNHRYFQKRLADEVERGIHEDHPLSLLMVDVNNFKRVNDAYGHRQGDAILKDIGSILRKNVRSVDIPARYGGDEFVIILPQTDASQAAIAAQRIKKAVASHQFQTDDEAVQLTISIGIASFPPITTKESLIDEADKALYRAKQVERKERRN
jgi:diguanylate cyclase (GGDEF)-like protein